MANFLVLDLKVIDSPQAGIGVARCLKALGHKVYGGDDTPFVTSSDLFEKTFVIEEIRTLNLDSLIKKLINLRDIYGIEYVVPCYDETVILFSYIKDKLDFIGLKLIATDIDIIKSLRKENLQNIFSGNKFVTPAMKVISSITEAKEYADFVGFPVFVKGMTKGAIQVKNDQELESAINRISSIWNNGEIKCIIQKLIKGKFVNILFASRDKNIVSYLEMRKIALDANGATWFGKLTNEKLLFDDVLEFCKKNGLNDAIIEIETILAKNGKYYVYEVNCRAPAWIYASALNGQNFLEIFFNPKGSTIFNIKEVFFGRESMDFIKTLEDISQYSNLQFYSKGAAYKNDNQKYPSELMF